MQSDKAKNILHYLSKEYKKYNQYCAIKIIDYAEKEQPVHCSVQMLNDVI